MNSASVLRRKVWDIAQFDAETARELALSTSVSPILAHILLLRGVATADDARRFLTPGLSQLHDPSLLEGVDWGVTRIREAIERHEGIMVHGDYDVDGVTSTALLVRVLRILGADVSWYVPHRQKEGYDIGIPGVEAAIERGAKVIVTVDCGTSAIDAVGYARSKGLDVVVTDHHEVGEAVSPANVVINPRLPGCRYPFRHLAGVGVAYKFAEALVSACGQPVESYRRRFCDLAAVGTVADVVPLLDENRAIVTAGIEELPRTGKKGLRALMDVAGLTGRPITSHSLAFGLAPRLNAAGRLGDAGIAVRLLLSTDAGEAKELASEIDRLNKERQAEQERISSEAMTQIADEDYERRHKVLVLASQGWHAGIVGVVASRITDRFSRPSVMVAIDEAGRSGVGSARSIRSFDIFEALMECGGVLDRCGGHARAAGLSISAARIEEFREAINGIADRTLTDDDLAPRLSVDCGLQTVDEVTMALARELKVLEPYGEGNPEPLFATRGALVTQRTRMGSAGTHLRLRLACREGRPLECVAFGWGESEGAFPLGSRVDVCYNVRTNEYNGSETVQAVLKDAGSDADSFGAEEM